jgi:hypothetical protein
MSDLRERMAVALASEKWVNLLGNGYDMNDLRALADAVIAELGLYREGSEPRTVTNEFGATFRIEGGHRYVTDWKADDE